VIAAEHAQATPARLVARALRARGTKRVFGLQGGHIQPLWDEVALLGIPIVDVRHEAAAVHMAHAHAELTDSIGIALVTAGPGVTNTLTAMANATSSRASVLLLAGAPPRPQDNMGPLQELPQVEVMRPVTRHARTARIAEQVPRELDEALTRALGEGGGGGAAYLEFPTDVLRAEVAPQLVLEDWFATRTPREFAPDEASVAAAVDALWSARRPVVIAGRGARGAGNELVRLLERLGALYLDMAGSRGLVPDEHPAAVNSMRGTVMSEADLVLTVGRKLDYQLGYGSPAVFPAARFVRIGAAAAEVSENRRGNPELFATARLALAAILRAAGDRQGATDRTWTSDLSRRHRERTAAYAAKLANAPSGGDGRMHPNHIFAAIAACAPDAIAIADGGDILSFARLGLRNRTYLDSGAFGCLGVGVPFAVAAALAFPERAVVSVNGDGAFGFNAMEVDTAVRHGAKAVFIVANNAAWNIERQDQIVNYDGRVVGTELAYSEYAMLGRALGAYGERVDDPADLPAALRRALAAAPAVLDVVVTREALSSDSGKGLGFVPDYQPLLAWDEAEKRRRGLGAPA